jgi:hypothetical protein
MINDKFELSKFGTFFDYGLAVSLFTHLHINCIVRCLAEIRQVMLPTSKFYLTYFEAPAPRYLSPLTHQPGNITTNFDADPFHYAFLELESLARQAGLTAQMIGAWGHPRAQNMLCLTVSTSRDRCEGNT